MKKIKKTAALITAAFMAVSTVSFTVCAEENAASETKSVDYSDPDNWAFWDYGEDKEADLFIICPLVDMGRDGNYNTDITNEKIRSRFIGALNQELGLYTDVAAVYSPYYRQTTYPVLSLDKAEQEQYLQIAYEDVRDAFLYYSDNCDESRPLILAGFSQGSDMLIRLMEELFGDERYSDRLVAAYAIGWSLSEEQTEKSPWLRPAQSEDDTGVIVMFNSEAEHITSSLMVGENEHTYSINPLNWKTDSTPADKSLNKGACFVDYDGSITSEIPELTGGYIDEKRGTLKVPDINEEDYPATLFEEGIFHIYDYQFFYRNLQENVAKRTAAFIAGRDAEDRAEEKEAAFYAMTLTAETDCTECYVGDEFRLTLTVKNTGDSDLENLVICFEDIPIYAAELLEAGKTITFSMKFMAGESDIESGGTLNLSASADNILEPERTTVIVKVKPVENNPSTGADISPLAVILALSGITAAVLRKKRG